MKGIITKEAIVRRNSWIKRIKEFSGSFGDDSDKLGEELEYEISKSGIKILIDHLRLCGNIPESYGHDSSEEKLYSKYTDCVLATTFKHLGLKSLVLKERADAADVEAFANNYSFVADAKSFRLSRTAKNQKDFKIQAMDNWKRGKPYAMVVCPVYQLPNQSSQIYLQATTRNVCIFTYSHLSLLLSLALIENRTRIDTLIFKIFKIIPALNPSKNAIDYWLPINRIILDYSKKTGDLWAIEKEASLESIQVGKEEALNFLSQERERIMKMSHNEAIKELIKVNKIESKINTINNVSDNGILSIN